MDFLEPEVWKDVEGYEDIYQISNHGNFKSLKRLITYNNTISYMRPEQNVTLKLPNGARYYQVILYKNAKNKLKRIHQLVANAFVSNVEHKNQVNHIDGNKLNNYFLNLEWVTSSENMIHSCHVLNQNVDVFVHNSKLTQLEVEFIRNNPQIFASTLAKKFNVSTTAVYNVKKYKSYKFANIKNNL
jgi:hypothetical protein